jgi:purine-nucleoside phosphorylase
VTTHPRTVLATTHAEESAAALAQLTGVAQHDVAVILGSGWMGDADRLGPSGGDLPVTDMPHFERPEAEGHSGSFRSVDAGGKRVLVFLGRTHFYEEHGVDAVTHRVRTAAAAGCKTLILTNACGGINPDWHPGTAVLIKDHINFTGVSPLHGAHFVDLTDLYSARLRRLCQEIEPGLEEGVYIQFPGPMYETAAEITMSKNMGADLVGMSTALEAIVGRSVGMEVLGISLVTNYATGIAKHPHSHAEVLAEGKAAAGRMSDLLAKVIRQL